MLQSIYTHAGCDYGCLYTYSPRHCFNPHTHAGCDLFVHLQCVQNMFQSTHPRRVWLRFRHCLKESLTCFNPHTHAGCDRSGRFTLCCSMDVSIHTPTQGVTTLAAVNSRNPRVSIHTPTQGVTQAEVWKVWHRSFNPHTHAGCDNRSSRPSPVLRVSIHTPTQGVTPLWRYALWGYTVSIHTPTQGVT